MPLFRGGITGDEIGDNITYATIQTTSKAIDIYTNPVMDPVTTIVYKLILLFNHIQTKNVDNLIFLLNKENSGLIDIIKMLIEMLGEKINDHIEEPKKQERIRTCITIINQIITVNGNIKKR